VELDGYGYTLDIDTVHLARTDSDDDAYIGLLRNFYLDQYRFFDDLHGGQLPHGIRVNNTGEVSLNETRQPVYPFMIRTSDPMRPDGLFAYSGGIDGDFFAVELVDGGRLRVSADDGRGAVTVVSSAGSLADDRWHTVDVVTEQMRARRSSVRYIRATDTSALTVLVDGKYRDRLALVGGRNTLDLAEGLYVGGVPASIYRQLPSAVRSRRGFSGCLATFVVNGRLYNTLTDATFVTNSVTAGCASMICLFMYLLRF